MFKHNFLTYGSQIIAKVLLEIIYFPIWWYSFGSVERLKKAWSFLVQREKSLGFKIWLKNIFVPMYGQYDLTGRIISFLIRSVQVIFRGLLLFVYFLFFIASLILWLLAPILLFIALFFQLGSFYVL